MVMRVLVACKESQRVCIAFRERGHEAYSCDIIDCSGGHPEWHIKDDVLKHLDDGWDLIISFQPCTDIAVSGARWFEEKRLSGSQEKSIRFFFEVWKYSNCSENPIGILNGGKYIKWHFPELYQEMKLYGFPFKSSQIIQPYFFGDHERKTTCLWLRGLPRLKPTNIVPIEYIIGKNGKKYTQTHYGTCFKTDRTEQGKIRSKTFPGIAQAMSEQWG